MNSKNRNKKNMWVRLEQQEIKLYNELEDSLAKLNNKKKRLN